MLAADKLLLQSNVKQRAIQLREKELNLFNDKCALRPPAARLRCQRLPLFLRCSPQCVPVVASAASMRSALRVQCSRASR